MTDTDSVSVTHDEKAVGGKSPPVMRR